MAVIGMKVAHASKVSFHSVLSNSLISTRAQQKLSVQNLKRSSSIYANSSDCISCPVISADEHISVY